VQLQLFKLQVMHSEDLRALTPLIYSHVTPYGTFRLDMNERFAIETSVAGLKLTDYFAAGDSVVGFRPEIWLNSNKGTKSEIGFYLRPFRPWSSALFATPKDVPPLVRRFWGLIPTVSCSFSSEKSCGRNGLG
jgi:hypothetical protein